MLFGFASWGPDPKCRLEGGLILVVSSEGGCGFTTGALPAGDLAAGGMSTDGSGTSSFEVTRASFPRILGADPVIVRDCGQGWHWLYRIRSDRRV